MLFLGLLKEQSELSMFSRYLPRATLFDSKANARSVMSSCLLWICSSLNAFFGLWKELSRTAMSSCLSALLQRPYSTFRNPVTERAMSFCSLWSHFYLHAITTLKSAIRYIHVFLSAWLAQTPSLGVSDYTDLYLFLSALGSSLMKRTHSTVKTAIEYIHVFPSASLLKRLRSTLVNKYE